MEIVFGVLAVVSGFMVITEKNTIHSVFYLVLTFVNSAIILIQWGIDYLGLLIVIIYVGAIAILFLFVLMMLNLKKEETNLMRYVPIGVIIGLIMIGEVWSLYPQRLEVKEGQEIGVNGGLSNIENLGSVMYDMGIITYGSLVLLVAMIGAIILTLNHTEGIKRQDLFKD